MPNTYIDQEGKVFFDQITYLTRDGYQKVREAFEWAREEHGDDLRQSGEPFFTHPLTVAYYLSEYFLDAPTLIAALLHDVAEDTTVSIEDIVARFGSEVAQLVEGLTKFDKMTAKAQLGRDLTDEELKNATIYKLFETLAKDVRIGLIKIFDRLHNMRTMAAMPPHKQQEKARETILIYAPLAEKLGMWLTKIELQQLSIAILYPAQYQTMCQQLVEYEEKQRAVFNEIAPQLVQVLTGVGPVEVKSDTPDIYGGYVDSPQEAQTSQRFDSTPRVIITVKEPEACYLVLAKIHANWPPVPKAFDDYIAKPRHNLYQSLHTAVLYNGRRIKLRIRTVDMHLTSQMGILAKWYPKELMPLWHDATDGRLTGMIQDISRVMDSGREITEGVKTVLSDIIPTDQVTVYTPQGYIRSLRRGATPIDFAYTIHTDVGHRCRGARVNDREVPLTYVLQEGDSVEILLHGSEPQRSWLDEDLGYLKTTGAINAVRRWFRRLPLAVATAQGQRILHNELNMLGLAHYDHGEIADVWGYETPDELYYALGRAELLPTAIATKILADKWQQTIPASTPEQQMVEGRDHKPFVLHNTGKRRLRLCQKCNPRPGDEIIGFIRKDNSVTIHTLGCTYMRPDNLRGGHALKLRWGGEETEPKRPLSVHISAHDRDGLLSEIANLMRDEHINITVLCSKSNAHQHVAHIVMRLAVSNPRQTVRVLHRIHSLANIIVVRCLNTDAPEQAQLENSCLFTDIPVIGRKPKDE
jgi:RelA/SpoT family (p)ppGpp synthetase